MTASRERHSFDIMSKRRSVGDRIREARLAAAVKQCELARLVGVHPSTACNWERGELEPTLAHVAKIASVLKVDLSWLATGETKPSA